MSLHLSKSRIVGNHMLQSIHKWSDEPVHCTVIIFNPDYSIILLSVTNVLYWFHTFPSGVEYVQHGSCILLPVD